jgi:hypothetical protein
MPRPSPVSPVITTSPNGSTALRLDPEARGLQARQLFTSDGLESPLRPGGGAAGLESSLGGGAAKRSSRRCQVAGCLAVLALGE